MASEKRIMMIVDDMELNRAILAELFHDTHRVIEAADGEEAMRLIGRYGGEISIVLLDLIMPVMNGFEVLQEMSDRRLIQEIPVIMITSENSDQAILKGYELGASDVITKPFNPEIVRKRVRNTVELNSYKQHLERQVDEQVAYIEKQAKELQKVNDFIIDSLSTIVEFRDLESGQHVKRIRRLTKILLKALARDHTEYDFTDEMISVISGASAMHDIGKISIPDNILLKPGKLTKEEFEVMKTHTTKGCELLSSLNYIKTSDYFKYCYDICRYHHERWDGRGYPDGLKGNEIPIWAQVVALADVYDALTSPRVYKAAFSHEKAYQMILDGECGVFNPMLLEEFTKIKDYIRTDNGGSEDQAGASQSALLAIPDEKPTAGSIHERTLLLMEMERKKCNILANMSEEVIFSYDKKKDTMEFSGKCRETLGWDEHIEHFSARLRGGNLVHLDDERELFSIIRELDEESGVKTLELRLRVGGEDYRWFKAKIYMMSETLEGVEKVHYIGKLWAMNCDQ